MYLSGKVQGVSFRYHSHEVATKLKLLGFVRNLIDGRVEILVAGPLRDVEQFLDWARKGPPEAKVQNVEILDITHDLPTEPFTIRRDGGKP
jgi:acylphosphatase